ncbi:MAG: septum formation initiator family protein [Flavobacteriales bacterium]
MERFGLEEDEEYIQKYSLLKNKYFWIGISFTLWMVFFDTNSFISHWKLEQNIRKIQSERNYLKKEIAIEKYQLERIHTDPDYLEKLAREHFHMKRDNEDLFIVTESKTSKKQPKKIDEP